MNSKQSLSIHFFFQGVRPNLKNRKKLKYFLDFLFANEGRHLNHLNYIFCTDKMLLKINRDYLNHNFYTDILTFSLSSPELITGEIYISADRVKENAKTYEVDFQKELHRVIFHGALHLCGYNDKSSSEKEIMTKKENFYLRKYFQLFHVKQ